MDEDMKKGLAHIDEDMKKGFAHIDEDMKKGFARVEAVEKGIPGWKRWSLKQTCFRGSGLWRETVR